MIYKRPACKNLKAYYYIFLKITFKEGALLTYTWGTANQNLRKKYIKE